jgi:hypothetical protein
MKVAEREERRDICVTLPLAKVKVGHLRLFRNWNSKLETGFLLQIAGGEVLELKGLTF